MDTTYKKTLRVTTFPVERNLELMHVEIHTHSEAPHERPETRRVRMGTTRST